MCVFLLMYFIVLSFINRESGPGGVSAFSKCKMYDVNLTTIQSWDYADWNTTKHHERHKALGKYWPKRRENQRSQKIERNRENSKSPSLKRRQLVPIELLTKSLA